METTELHVLVNGTEDDATPVAVFTTADALERFRAFLRQGDQDLLAVRVPVNPYAFEIELGMKPWVVGLRQDRSVATVRVPNWYELITGCDGGAYVGRSGYWKNDQTEWVCENLFVVVLWSCDETAAVAAARDRMSALCRVWPERIPVRIFPKPAWEITVKEGEDK